jgi:hypothetical protein
MANKEEKKVEPTETEAAAPVKKIPRITMAGQDEEPLVKIVIKRATLEKTFAFIKEAFAKAEASEKGGGYGATEIEGTLKLY